MSPSIPLCTVATKNQIAQVRALAHSYHHFHPDGQVFLGLVDRVDGFFDPAEEPFITIPLEHLHIPHWGQFAFACTPGRMAVAVKPYLLRYVRRNFSFERLISLDSDTILHDSLARLDPIFDAHQTVLAAGFIGVTRGAEADAFLAWWQDQMVSGLDQAETPLTTFDPHWIDRASTLFQGVCIWDDPTANVGTGDFPQRPVDVRDGRFVIGDTCILFAHFNGVGPDNPDSTAPHHNHGQVPDLSAGMRLLVRDYQRRRFDQHQRLVENWPNAFDVFSNGVPIPLEARALFAEQIAAGAWWPTPFEVGLGTFYEYLNMPYRVQPSEPGYLTNFGAFLCKQSLDIMTYYPGGPETQGRALAEWFRTYGRARFPDLPDVFLTPMGVPQRPTAPPAIVTITPQTHRAWTVTRGVNVIGFLHSENGIAEVARSTAQTLSSAGYPLNIVNLSIDFVRKQDRSIDVLGLDEGISHPVNVLHVNAADLAFVTPHLGVRAFANRYMVGYWFWELAQFPERWYDRFSYLDEVWVASQFCRDSIAAESPIPVTVIPPLVEPHIASAYTRAHFDLPTDRFLFLVMFDGNSFTERKNPLAVIRAFWAAFGARSPATRPVLVFKVSNLDQSTEAEQIRAALAEVGGVIIDRYLMRAEVNGLLTVCDALVSLHRAEGFGLVLAEAMYFGKPVIATNYSANTDFMTPANSYPIDYTLTVIAQTLGPYDAGQVWATPDEDQAAAVMRQIVDSPDPAIGLQAAADIRRLYGRVPTAAAMITRLDAIYQRPKVVQVIRWRSLSATN